MTDRATDWTACVRPHSLGARRGRKGSVALPAALLFLTLSQPWPLLLWAGVTWVHTGMLGSELTCGLGLSARRGVRAGHARRGVAQPWLDVEINRQ